MRDFKTILRLGTLSTLSRGFVDIKSLILLLPSIFDAFQLL